MPLFFFPAASEALASCLVQLVSCGSRGRFGENANSSVGFTPCKYGVYSTRFYKNVSSFCVTAEIFRLLIFCSRVPESQCDVIRCPGASCLPGSGDFWVDGLRIRCPQVFWRVLGDSASWHGSLSHSFPKPSLPASTEEVTLPGEEQGAPTFLRVSGWVVRSRP
jgi:hypothetical protein